MTLLENARVVGTSTDGQFEDQRGSDGRVWHAPVADAWAPRKDNAGSQQSQITPEMAFLPFTRFALENKTEFNPRQTLGLSYAWGYTRHDSALNPGGGRCNASPDSISCAGDNAVAQYKGSTADVPQLYANKEVVNGAPITRQYFAPSNEVPSVSPDSFRYLNNVQDGRATADRSMVQLASYKPDAQVAAAATVNDSTRVRENFEAGMEKPVKWENNSINAFVKAVESDKPMVVVFGDDSSALFKKQMAELQQDQGHLMSKLSDRAVFVIGKPNEDEYARRMATHLKLTDYPTVSVIAPRTDQLTETYRMEGYFNVSDIFSDLDKALPKKKAEPKLAQTVVA